MSDVARDLPVEPESGGEGLLHAHDLRDRVQLLDREVGKWDRRIQGTAVALVVTATLGVVDRQVAALLALLAAYLLYEFITRRRQLRRKLIEVELEIAGLPEEPGVDGS